jgi:hypothetical protein
MLIKLKAPKILDGGGIGRMAEKSSEAPNVAEVVLLRLLPKPRIFISCNIRWRSELFGAAVMTGSMASSFPLK